MDAIASTTAGSRPIGAGLIVRGVMVVVRAADGRGDDFSGWEAGILLVNGFGLFGFSA